MDSKTKASLKDIANQSGLVLTGDVGMMLMGFISTTIIAKYYGSEVLGGYNLVKSSIGIVGIITVLGLDQGLFKYVPRCVYNNEKNRLSIILGDAIIISVLTSAILSLIVYRFRYFIAEHIFSDEGLVLPIVVASAIILPYTINKILSGLYRGLKMSYLFKYAGNLFRKLLFLVLIITALLMQIRDTEWVLLAYALSFVFSISLLVYVITKSERSRNISITRSVRLFTLEKWKGIRERFLSFSATMILISAVTKILSRIDIIMLGIFLESKKVGYYTVALLVSGVLTFSLGSINKIFPSYISEMADQKDSEGISELYSITTRWAILINIPIIIAFLIYPEVFLKFFGEEYTSAIWVLVVLSAGHFINTSVGSNGHILKMYGRENIVLYNNIGLAITNIVLNVVLIPRIGILGAAIATTMSRSIISIVKVFEVNYIFSIFPYNNNYYYVLYLSAGLIAFNLGCLPLVSGLASAMVLIGTSYVICLAIILLLTETAEREIIMSWIQDLNK